MNTAPIQLQRFVDSNIIRRYRSKIDAICDEDDTVLWNYLSEGKLPAYRRRIGYTEATKHEVYEDFMEDIVWGIQDILDGIDKYPAAKLTCRLSELLSSINPDFYVIKPKNNPRKRRKRN